MAKFTCSAYPELRLDVHDGEDRTTVQFVDGAAEVSEKTLADAVKKAAADQPALGIIPAAGGRRSAGEDAD